MASGHGAEGAVAIGSLMTCTWLPDVHTPSQSAPNLAAVVMMLLVRSIAHLRQCHVQLQHHFVQC